MLYYTDVILVHPSITQQYSVVTHIYITAHRFFLNFSMYNYCISRINASTVNDEYHRISETKSLVITHISD